MIFMAYTPEQRKSHITELQTYLYALSHDNASIPPAAATGIFDNDTELAVRAFQEAYQLPVNGQVDRATWDAIAEAHQLLMRKPKPLAVFPPSYILQPGDTGKLSELIQLLLHFLSRSYSNIPQPQMTGRHDESTAAAVRALQKAANLPETGTVDAATWNALAAVIEGMNLAV